jgi:hypothetical protein
MFKLNLNGPNTSCVGDGSIIKIELMIAGGTAPYTVDYDDVILYVNENCNPVGKGGTSNLVDDDGILSFDYSGFAAGNYTLGFSVKDAAGCGRLQIL